MVAFLDDYPTLRKETLDELHDMEDALFDLRDECLDQNLFADSEHVYEMRDALYEEIFDLLEDTDANSPRAGLLVAAKMRDTPQEIDKEAKPTRQDYVNKWLLNWVQDSTLGVIMLRAQIYLWFENVHDQDQILGDSKWATLAIEHWDTDKAGEKTDVFFNESKRDAIAGRTGNLEGSGTSSLELGHDDWSSLGAALEKLERGITGRVKVSSQPRLASTATNQNPPY